MIHRKGVTVYSLDTSAYLYAINMYQMHLHIYIRVSLFGVVYKCSLLHYRDDALSCEIKDVETRSKLRDAYSLIARAMGCGLLMTS